MKYIVIATFILFSFSACKKKAKLAETKKQESFEIFNQIKTTSNFDNGKSWGFRLYGSIMLIDTTAKEIYANQAAKNLVADSTIFKGVLNDSFPKTDTTLFWDNQMWSVFILPLPADSFARNELIFEQLYHQHEKKIGLDKIQTSNCDHLYEKSNRIWMLIEAEALKSALKSSDLNEQKEHIRMALSARKIRKLYNGDKVFSKENDSGIKYGIPKLAGILISGRSYQENCKYMIDELSKFQQSDNFMLTFPKVIFPAYGLLMSNNPANKLKYMNRATNIDFLVTTLYDFKFNEDFEVMIDKLRNNYRGEEFENEENTKINNYKTMFFSNPTIQLKISEDTKLTFDPKDRFPFEKSGYIYKNLSIIDNWGKATITEGTYIDSNFIYISTPFKKSEQILTGSNWNITLNKNYTILPIDNSNNYTIIKQ